MRRHRLLAIALIAAITASPAAASAGGSVSSASVEARNRRIIADAYHRWALGGRSFYDEVLAPDMIWTIVGTGVGTGTYRGRATFQREVIAPFAALLAMPIRPTVHAVWADGDDVIVRWSGDATTRRGKPYHNDYVWIFHMRDGRADRVTAFLDLRAYEAVFRDR